jgi:hypothetical protein
LSTVEEGFGGALDLSGANTEGFPALDAGTYDCELFDYSWSATKGGSNDDGTPKKMPEGTPMLKTQLRVIEPEHENRRLFDQFVIPPASYEKEKREVMLGMLVRFLTAMGLEESDVKSKKFDLNKALEDLKGEPVRVTVNKEPKYMSDPEENLWDNKVKGYKRAGTGSSGERGKLL